ncbi:MAG: twin-arginine translocation signal domain-containing protein [Chitinophagaceae bacterium]|nr:MAG: twin-arginine translocation signal domain-containing protein [Chitinophagaceae bacterium]
MNRRSFVKNSCLACLGIATGSTLLTSCKTMLHTSGSLTDDGIKFPLRDFALSKGTSIKHHAYIIIRNDVLQYPICVYRLNETTYSALYMQCSHQGAELQASGDRLTCPAHGSEFDNSGLAKQGPADQSLRSFPTSIIGEDLFIDLRKKS